MKWLILFCFIPLSASLRQYKYDAGRYTKSPWIKNRWPRRKSPADRIFNLHVFRDHLKHVKYYESKQQKATPNNEKVVV